MGKEEKEGSVEPLLLFQVLLCGADTRHKMEMSSLFSSMSGRHPSSGNTPQTSASVTPVLGLPQPLGKQAAALFAEDSVHQLDITAAAPQQLFGGQLQFVEPRRLGVCDRGAEIDDFHASPVQRGHAHWTGFARGGDDGPSQVDLSGHLTGVAQRIDLGMSRDVRRG